MRAIVGIDGSRLYRSALRLLKRLDMDVNEVTLVHAADPTLPLAGFEVSGTGDVQAELVTSSLECGNEVLEDAQEDACAVGLRTTTALRLGTPAATLLDYAHEHQIDLVAVTSARKGAFGSMFFGSVSRSLAIASRIPILVAKGDVECRGKLTVVLATDHSDYSNQCIDRFLEAKPKGIERVIVTTAYEIDDYEATLLHVNLAKLGGQVEDWIEEKLTAMSKAVVAKFEAVGIPAEFIISHGHTNDVLRKVMDASGADLLVLGAQGHGFVERLVIGSVSLHQVVAEPYSVLVMRV